MAKNDVNFYQSWQVNIGISVNLRNTCSSIKKKFPHWGYGLRGGDK